MQQMRLRNIHAGYKIERLQPGSRSSAGVGTIIAAHLACEVALAVHPEPQRSSGYASNRHSGTAAGAA